MTRETMMLYLADNYDMLEAIMAENQHSRQEAESEMFATLMLAGVLKPQDLPLFLECMNDV